MYQKFIKRFLDIVLSALAIVILSPLFVILAVCVRIGMGSPVLFKQRRIGKNEKAFDLYKFRSMKVDAEKSGPALSHADGQSDPRLTRIGRWLRAHHLDELPQLWNVLIGDMSLVGPRPEVRKYVDLYTEEQKQVLRVRPGITDYASIEYVDENRLLAASQAPDKTYIEEIMPQKIALNMRYINHPTVGEYFRILFLTTIAIFSKFNP